jgi:hypothetical protein
MIMSTGFQPAVTPPAGIGPAADRPSHPPPVATPVVRSSPTSALRRERWNPYVVGALLGVLSWLVFAIVDKPLGVSTSVSAAAGAVCDAFGYDVSGNAYWSKVQPKLDYGMIFLVGTMLGAAASAVLSRSWRLETVPGVWRQRFGSSAVGRFVAAFLGGALLMYGARMADGCTSGHGISGSLQLAVSSWTFFLTMFIAGVVAALAIFDFNRRAAGPTTER